VGVFVNETPEKVLETMEAVGLDFAQLHGDERPEDCAAIPIDRWYKALCATDRSVLAMLAAWPCRCLLLDAGRPGRPGGTGETCDWTVAAEAAKSHRVILAGGLRASNVGEAIRAVMPYGVDTASGIESKPGIKDPKKMRAFVEAARAAT
jgi:phosphoribosylanthranilate isomerase